MVEVLIGGPRDRRGPFPRWAVLLGVAVVVIGLTATIVRLAHLPPDGVTAPPARSSPTTTASSTTASSSVPPLPTCPGTTHPAAGGRAAPPVAALVFTGASPMAAVDRWDQKASTGPWAVVVRRWDGSLGRHSAVVTFPVTDNEGQPVPVGAVSGNASSGQVSWPLGGTRARVRGDLSESALLQIAAATHLAAGRPVVQPTAGYTVTSSGPYRSSHIHEVRYNGQQLSPELSGLVVASVTSGAALEDQMYTSSLTACGAVNGQPAVVTATVGGNGALAWQTANGQTSYLGYSGSALTGTVLAAVSQLAAHSTAIDTTRWHTLRPQTINQRNDPS